LARRGLDELKSRAVHPDEHLYIGGTASVASAFDAVEVVRNVLVTLEQEYVVVSLLRDMLDRGVSVAIGSEHGVEQLAACSVVVAPYVVEGEAVGTVGLLGPTRMNYPQALAAVDVVSQRLGERLSDGSPQ
jgi:heat-inducible transcriptional repressor